MARTTAALVGKIIEVDDGDDLTAFIDTASLLVTDICTSSGYSDAKLELVERWLSAHYYDIHRPRAFSENARGIGEQYEFIKVDLHLNVTKYGQQAMIIDTAGNLAALNNSMKKVTIPLAAGGTAGSRWLGTAWE